MPYLKKAVENNELDMWFAIRVTYSREIKLKAYLDAIDIESFIVMRLTEIAKNGEIRRELLPVVHNLIFIHTKRSTLDVLKKDLERSIPIRYIIDKAKKMPIIVPDKQMKHFIVLSELLNEQSLYLTHVEPALKKGMRVRVTDGNFKGIEGTVVRLKRDRRVMVNIEGVMAIVSAYIHPSSLQRIDNE